MLSNSGCHCSKGSSQLKGLILKTAYIITFISSGGVGDNKSQRKFMLPSFGNCSLTAELLTLQILPWVSKHISGIVHSCLTLYAKYRTYLCTCWSDPSLLFLLARFPAYASAGFVRSDWFSPGGTVLFWMPLWRLFCLRSEAVWLHWRTLDDSVTQM